MPRPPYEEDVFAEEPVFIEDDETHRARFRHLYTFSLSDALVITDAVRRVRDFTIVDSLTVGESMAEAKVVPVADKLTINEVASTAGSTYTRSVTDVLTINEGAAVLSSREAKQCTDPATVSARDDVVLTYPYTAPSLTVHLRNPEFGDERIVNTNVEMRRTRSGQLNPVRGSMWPTFDSLSLTFRGLSQQQKDDFITFAETSAAGDVGLLDHYNRQWRGILLLETLKVVQEARGCDYSLSFQFRGDLV